MTKAPASSPPQHANAKDRIAVVRFATDSEAQEAIDNLSGTAMDRNHTIRLERVEGSERFRGVQSHGVVDDEQLGQLSALQIGDIWARVTNA